MRDLDTLLAALDAKLADLRAMIAEAREPTAPAKSEPGGHWSPWLEWPEGEDIECPLPPGTRVKIERGDGVVFDIADAASVEWVGNAGTLRIRRFSYHSRDDLGWLSRGDWIPPAELWAEDCPVRIEWAADIGHDVRTGFERLEDWRGVHHVRLLAREAKVGLPEGFRIDEDGALWSEFGPVLNQRERERYAPAVIRQAVDAWLREMGDEG